MGFHTYWLFISAVLCLGVWLLFFPPGDISGSGGGDDCGRPPPDILLSLERAPAVVWAAAHTLVLPLGAAAGGEAGVAAAADAADATRADCHHFDCFDVYRCAVHQGQMTVHIQAPKRFLDASGAEIAPLSREFADLLESIASSPYFTSDAAGACVFVPPIDLLNEHATRLLDAGRALRSMPDWHGGRNNLVFTMLPGSYPDYRPQLGVPHGQAMVAGAGLTLQTFRRGFDIALPVFSPYIQNGTSRSLRQDEDEKRWLLLLSAQTNISPAHRAVLRSLPPSHDVLLLERCAPAGGAAAAAADVRCGASVSATEHAYPAALGSATFCLVLRGVRLAQPILLEALHWGCIPVIAVDGLVLPFSSVIDWKRFAIRIYEHDLPNVADIVRQISAARIHELRAQGHVMYARHFSSMSLIGRTALDILNDRIFTHAARTYADWNVPPPQQQQPSDAAAPEAEATGQAPPPPPHAAAPPAAAPPKPSCPAGSGPAANNPLFLPTTPPATDGFTAVILTYDRLESLFAVISRVAETPSLTQILVVWNNQELGPPDTQDPSQWPKVNKPIKVVRTAVNALTNRFYPYEEIETEAILSMDDDIVMLTADELEFGYQVWREFPDRIVGFPSRTHRPDPISGGWRYESEWTSDVSMVLTGAAFYHKYWNYLFTAAPNKEAKEIRSWVDRHMNCEDIAMNFMIANMTGKAPIKVAPRKKFKCLTPACMNADMLSTSQMHVSERTDCINMLAQAYGYMPLKSVDFRADPVLYKDNLPEKLKKFNNLGSL